ncbi:MAG: two-component sensor histidine kinase [Bacteroidota bacterium]|jgi:two-component system phosphate regulon sensor histidine kinase PhoR|nr:two-component sensor histidine kinase [Bacteroidota bacterium]
MKPDRNNSFILLSSLALLIVLLIQVNWILDSAKDKEELFNEKANIVLARTTEALLADQEICRSMESGISRSDTTRIDSLFKHYMNFYDFHIAYTFKIFKPAFRTVVNDTISSSEFYTSQPGCYSASFDEINKTNKWQLKLNFPDKKQFIMAEMGPLFVTSVILTFLVLFMFWRTTKSLIAEKKLSEHTTDFLNNMTHEFKTPLTNIALAGKMITRDANRNNEDKIKHYSGIILAENEKLKLQVEQVLSMTALERGEIPLQMTELNIHELIENVAKSMSVQIENRSGVLNQELNAQNSIVTGDKMHLTNTLCNLLDNSIKYSTEKPELLIRTYNHQNKLVLEIADKGIGIEKEYHSKVFDMFFRIPTGDIHNVKGFGLGLSYIKKIIDLHKGSVEIDSEKDKGTKVIITLPND